MDQKYWDRFKSVHTQSTVAFVESILNSSMTYDEFMKKVTDACPAKKTHAKKKLFKFLVKYNWITESGK